MYPNHVRIFGRLPLSHPSSPPSNPPYNMLHMETGVISSHIDCVCDDLDDLYGVVNDLME